MCNISQAADKLVLNASNHVVLNGDISEKIVHEVIIKIASHPKKGLYLYINSPGGSVHAGNTMINFLKSTDKKVFCIADYAASMAFYIMQYCHKRIVSNNSVLMQHESSLRIEDSVPNFMSKLKWLRDMINTTETNMAKKLDLSYDEYKGKIAGDWWIYGKHAVDEGIADEVRLVSCTNDLIKTTTGGGVAVAAGLFGLTALASPKVSACPIFAPIVDDTAQAIDRQTWNAAYIKEINRYTP